MPFVTVDTITHLLYIYNMNKNMVTIKLWVRTRRLINITRALTEESAVSFIHRLVEAELKKVSTEKSDNLSLKLKGD